MNNQQINTAVATKKCSRCGRVKPLTEYYNDKSKPDKRKNVCGSCARAYTREYQRRLGKHTGFRISRSSLMLLEQSQVESVIREMAETQFIINTTQNEAKRKIISILRELSSELVAPLKRLTFFRSSLELFVEENNLINSESETEDFRFGSIRCRCGRMELKLKADYAGAMIGKP